MRKFIKIALSAVIGLTAVAQVHAQDKVRVGIFPSSSALT